jgi:hypothetical protein
MKTLTLMTMLAGLGVTVGGVAGAQEQPPPYDAATDNEEYPEYQEQVEPEAAQPVDPYEGSAQVQDDNPAAYDDGYDPNAYSQFESSLAPYGEWQDDPTYGRIWTPSQAAVGYDFSPYASGGHWVGTEYGWTWVSDWDWGWAPFHYGRWVSLRHRGWCWIPGTVWGPGWVSWRGGHGTVGWAPLPPSRVRVHDYRRPGWRFTAAGELGNPRMRYLGRNGTVFARTQVIHNDRAMPLGHTQVRYNAGPAMRGGPVRLADAAPRALPRFHVAPHVGQIPIQSRTWDRRTQGQQVGAPRQNDYRGQPQYRAPQQPNRVPQAQPQYRAPSQPQQPQQQYRAPSQPQQQPAPRYHDNRSAPRSYYQPGSAPRQQYAAPRQQFAAPRVQTFAAPRVERPEYHAPTFGRSAQPAWHGNARVHDGRRR